MGNLSVDTWRTIYDTLKKQRGTQDAADTPLGQMFALLDGYEVTLRQSEAENTKLRAALELWHLATKINVTMEEPQYAGVSFILGRQAWERARAALGGEND